MSASPSAGAEVASEASEVSGEKDWTRWLLPLVLVSALVYFVRLGAFPLFDGDEPRYAQACREMLARNDWITPTFNGQLRFQKPIFIYWLILASYSVLGVNEWAARLWSALAGTLLVLITARFVARRLGTGPGLLAGASVAFNPQALILSRVSTPDATLCLFSTASLFAFYSAYTSPPERARGRWLAFWVFAGFAALTKGPVGVGIPLLVVGLFTLLEQRLVPTLRASFLLPGLLLMALVVVPWYAAVIGIHGQTFTDFFFGREHLGRFSEAMEGHHGPIVYYLIALIPFFLPWSGLLPAGIRLAWQSRRPDPGAPDEAERRLARFAGVWALFVIGVFSLSSTKLPHYIYPAYPALALLVALAWKRVAAPSSAAPLRRTLLIPGFTLAVLLLGAGIAAPSLLDKAGYPGWAQWVIGGTAVLAAAGLAYACFALRTGRPDPARVTLVAASAVVAALLAQVAAPAANEVLYGGMVRLSRRAAQRNPARFAVWKMDASAAVFYYGKPGVPIGLKSAETLRDWQRAPGDTLILCRKRNVRELRRLAEVLEEDGGFALLRLRTPVYAAR